MRLYLIEVDNFDNEVSKTPYNTLEDIIEDMKINIEREISCYIYDELLQRILVEYNGEITDPLDLLI